ncbi:retrovirus-related pol polyprotein from transposon TNT 1-94 [Tanacetum coccineum]
MYQDLSFGVATSHTGNHPEGGFTPFETIRKSLVIIGRRSHSGFEGETFEPERMVRHQKPTGRTFTLVGNAFPLTRITATNKVPLRVPIPLEVVAPKHVVTRVYNRRPKVPKSIQNSKPKVEDSITTNRMLSKLFYGIWTPDAPSTCLEIALSSPISFINFSVLSNSVTTKLRRLWDLEVAFQKHTCFVRNMEGVDLLSVYMVALTMLIYAKAPLFLWAEAVATACYTQSRSIIRRRHRKTPYELLHDRKPDLSYLHVFGALCYSNNDSENLGKLQAKADIGIFIEYATKKKAYRIYNRRTQKNIKTILVDFDELPAMASEQCSLELALHEMTPATPSSGLVPNPPSSAPFVPPSRHE